MRHFPFISLFLVGVLAVAIAVPHASAIDSFFDDDQYYFEDDPYLDEYNDVLDEEYPEEDSEAEFDDPYFSEDEEYFDGVSTEEFPISFSDIDGHALDDSIQYILNQRIVRGYDDGTYKPDQLLNRAELTKIAVEAAYDPSDFAGAAADCFSDVSIQDWFSTYVCFGLREGLLSGNPDGTFRPGDYITQPAALKIVFNALFQESIDESEADEWYQVYLDEAEYMGMLYFNIENAASHYTTRAEMAYFIAWILDEDGEYSDQIAYDEFGDDYDLPEDDEEYFGFDEEPQSPEDCFDDEAYDPEGQFCYIDCDQNGVECDDVDFISEDDLGAWYDDVADDFDDHLENNDYLEEDGAFVSYAINADDTISLKRKSLDGAGGDVSWMEDDELHQNIWQSFAHIIPTANRSFVAEFHVFTDGPDGTMAYVSPAEEDETKWVIGFDVEDSVQADGTVGGDEFILTMIHEYAHILTLNHNQIVPSDIDIDDSAAVEYARAACRPHYFTDEGCAKPHAFLNLFFKKFWGGKRYQEWRDLQDRYDRGDQIEVDIVLYEKYPQEFVTEYAATNPEEDIAESFSYFVFKDKPTGTTVKDKKVLSFYDFPSLVQLRDAIRKRL